MKRIIFFATLLLWFSAAGLAQTPAPNAGSQPPSTLQPLARSVAIQPSDAMRETIAVSFPQDHAVPVKLRGTARLPKADGEAKIERKRGTTDIEIQVDDMKPASLFGGDFNTYVLWAVSPEGQVQNVGEFVLDGDHGKLHVSTNLSTFGLFVTAEPHYLVTLPSRMVVVEMTQTVPKSSQPSQIAALHYRGYEGVYKFERDTLANAKEADGLVQSELKQAFTAVQLAQRAGANEFASAELAVAQKALQTTLTLSEQKKTRRNVDSQARETVRLAFAAQKLAEDRAYQSALDSERRAREAQLADLAAKADRANDEAERARLQAERRRMEADFERQAQQQAAQRAAEEQRRRLDAEQRATQLAQGKAEADARAQVAMSEAEKARRERQEVYDKMRLALSQIAETRESARGLIVNIPDVLFDFNKSTIRQDGRERLSKIAGIIIATPGSWGLSVEGHTDSVGSEAYNQTLSEKRADTVKGYLTAAGVPRDSVTAAGFGKSRPIASNDSGEGRQRNRRVEIIITDRTKTTSQ